MQLAVTSPYNSFIYNPNLVPSSEINKHIIVFHTISLEEFYDDTFKHEELPYIQQNVLNTLRTSSTHPNIRNWKFILSNPKSYLINIVESYEFNDTEVCIVKTCWLRIFIKIWKTYRQKKLKYRNPRNLFMGRITGFK